QAFSEHGRIPPQAIELEEAILGALMLEQNALTTVIDILKPQVFYKEAHQVIYAAIYRLFAKSEPVDILTVTNELKSSGELELVGGAYFITQLTNRVASTANVEYHARIISQKYIQRELIRISSDIIKDAFEDTTDVFDLLDKAEQNLFAVSENNLRREYDSMQSLVRDAIKDIESARDHEGNLRGIPSGFTDLDRITAGWQKSDLIVLAARPGMGKTALVLSMARNIAVDFNIPLAIFSLEMASIQLVTRLISSETQLSADKLKKGNLENYEWEQLNAKIGKLVDAPLFIDDTPALSIFELRAKCRRLKAQHDIQMIIIDYIQLMSIGGDNKGNREQEISTISRSLKALAKELNVPVITLSQLNRSVETRGGSKRPVLSDLRESGAIEQDADMVMFIYRPEYYKIDEDEAGNSTQGMAELIIAKHRNGALADVKMQFIGQYAKFVDYEGPSYNDYSGSPDDYDYPADNSYTVQSKMNDLPDDQPF
ncbi:MAG: replicative DNA helicase, partial [Bacteroidales bacterium]|nr:replicative DNA helicase [Bacteroidales bacterium]